MGESASEFHGNERQMIRHCQMIRHYLARSKEKKSKKKKNAKWRFFEFVWRAHKRRYYGDVNTHSIEYPP